MAIDGASYFYLLIKYPTKYTFQKAGKMWMVVQKTWKITNETYSTLARKLYKFLSEAQINP